MTILFSYIGKDQLAVAGDGNITYEGKILPESKNKTFSLRNGLIVVAYANNMSIDHKEYSHGQDIGYVLSKIESQLQNVTSFDLLVNELIMQYVKELNSSNATGPRIQDRNSNLIFGARENIVSGDFVSRLYCIVFCSHSNELTILKDSTRTIKGETSWIVSPPEEDKDAIAESIKVALPYHSNLTATDLATRGIEIGIEASKRKNGGKTKLGGQISVIQTPPPSIF
jgi:hypothetical protein